MCFSGRTQSYQSTAQPVTLPPAPQMAQAPMMLQSTPAPARPADQTTYKRKGRRALTIPQQTSMVNIPGS